MSRLTEEQTEKIQSQFALCNPIEVPYFGTVYPENLPVCKWDAIKNQVAQQYNGEPEPVRKMMMQWEKLCFDRAMCNASINFSMYFLSSRGLNLYKMDEEIIATEYKL